jgi:hypothetical protein
MTKRPIERAVVFPRGTIKHGDTAAHVSDPDAAAGINGERVGGVIAQPIFPREGPPFRCVALAWIQHREATIFCSDPDASSRVDRAAACERSLLCRIPARRVIRLSRHGLRRYDHSSRRAHNALPRDKHAEPDQQKRIRRRRPPFDVCAVHVSTPPFAIIA